MNVELQERIQNPMLLLENFKQQSDTISGFRYFHDHSLRVLSPCLLGPHCGKIILTRSPVKSYISWEIVAQTGQWKLQKITRKKRADKVHFDADGRINTITQNFMFFVKARLQISGQTAFLPAYVDLQNQAVIDGLAQFLGGNEQVEKLAQNGCPKTQSHCLKRLRILLTCSMHWLKLVCLI